MITVMALLAVVVNRLVGSNAEATAEELGLVRSYQAAQSGLEFGLNKAFPPPGSGRASSCAASTSYPAFTVAGLNACQVDVQCQLQSYDGDNYYTITATGTCGEVSRTFQIRAR